MDKTVSVSLINSLSPLQFSDEMVGSLIQLAKHNQACVVASLIMAGGCLTDALAVDAQAGVESALALSTAARSGVNFILHSCGILGSYIAMSFEKFLVDEEACGLVRSMQKPLEITDDSIDIDVIKSVGIGGQYLTHPKTFQLCRTEFHMPSLMSRMNPDAWSKAGKKSIDMIAEEKVAQRLATYEKPEIDLAVEKELTQYVETRKNK